MKVTLINYTQDAAELLIYTKSTRLQLEPGNFEAIKKWPVGEKYAALEYMANTIPSSWEFVDYVFSIEGVSRAFTHQFVRTRTGSYAQQSMRVTDMGTYEYISTAKTEDGKRSEQYVNATIMDEYHHMIAKGETIEDARGILPTNIATNIVAKFNLRTLSEMAKSRTGGRTQGEYRDVFAAMCQCVIDVHPWAELFLFPRGRDYWAELEKAVAQVPDWSTRTAILKIIDQMRKS